MSQRLLSLFEKFFYFPLHFTRFTPKMKDLVTVTCLAPPEGRGATEDRAMSSTTQEENKAGGAAEGPWWTSNSREPQPHTQQMMGCPHPVWGQVLDALCGALEWCKEVLLFQHYLNEEHIYSYVNTNIYTSKYLQLYAFVNHCAAFSLQNTAGDFNS